jgi:hypothetical protein
MLLRLARYTFHSLALLSQLLLLATIWISNQAGNSINIGTASAWVGAGNVVTTISLRTGRTGNGNGPG